MVYTLPIISKPLDANPDHLIWEALSVDTRNTDPDKVRKIPKSIFITPNLNTSKTLCPAGSKLGPDGKCLQTVKIDKIEVLKKQIESFIKVNQTTNPPLDVDYEYDEEEEVGGVSDTDIFAVPPLSLGFPDERRPPPYPSRIIQQDSRTKLPTILEENDGQREPFLGSTDTVTQRQSGIKSTVSDIRSKTESPNTPTILSTTSATATTADIHQNRHQPTPVDRILFPGLTTQNSKLDQPHSQHMEQNYKYDIEQATDRRKMTETVPIGLDPTTVLISTTTEELQTVQKVSQDAKTEVNINPTHNNVKKDTLDNYEVTINTPKSQISTSDVSPTKSVPAMQNDNPKMTEEESTITATTLDDKPMETSSNTKSNSELKQSSTDFPQMNSEPQLVSSESILSTLPQSDDSTAMILSKETTEAQQPTAILEPKDQIKLDPLNSKLNKLIETTTSSQTTIPSLSLTSHASSSEGAPIVTSTSSQSTMEHTYEIESSDKPVSTDGSDEIEIMKKVDNLSDDDDDYTDDNKNLTALMEEELFLQGNGMILTNYGNNNDDHVNSNTSEIDYTVSSSLQSSSPTPPSSSEVVLNDTIANSSKINTNSTKTDEPTGLNNSNDKPTVYSTFLDALASSSSVYNRNAQLNPLHHITIEPNTRSSVAHTQNPSVMPDKDTVKSLTTITTGKATATLTTPSITSSTSSDQLIDTKLHANLKHSTVGDDTSNYDDGDVYDDKEDEQVDGDDESSSDTIRLGINCYLKNHLKHFYIMCT